MLSLSAQILSMTLAAIAGRFLCTSRLAILFLALLGAAGAMVASLFNDGQGAFALLLATPIIYYAAVAGRDPRRPPSDPEP